MYNKDMHCNKAVFVKDKVFRENKMQLNFRQQFNTIAKQAVQMHGSNWLAINSLSCDRTPEGYISSGFQEGSGYA
jgi:hypothetical protein